MRKEYLKDIAKQMCQTALEQFDTFSTDEVENITEKDKDYVFSHIEKQRTIIINKIKDENILNIYSVNELFNYCNDKELL